MADTLITPQAEAGVVAIPIKTPTEEQGREMTAYDTMNELDDLEIHSEISKQTSQRKRVWKYWRYVVLYLYHIVSKSFSIIDLVTDLILLSKAVRYNYMLLTVMLFVSILSPYIISYSSGVKLFLYRRTFDSFKGFEKWLMIIYILPSGVFYFLLLDLVDILFQIYRVFGYLLLNKSYSDLKESEETLAEQLGLNRMSYEVCGDSLHHIHI